MAYATVGDLGTYIGGQPPADAARLLDRATDLVDAALTSSIFTTDANGNPTDVTVIAALNKATCAQAEYWIATGDELDMLSGASSYSIEGISVTRGATARRRYRLCDRAWEALRAAKLVPGTVYAT